MQPINQPYIFKLSRLKNNTKHLINNVGKIFKINSLSEKRIALKGVFRILYFEFNPLVIFAIILAIPLAILVRVIRPVLLLRFGRILASGFGQFALIPEVYLSRKNAGLEPTSSYDFFFYDGKPCNNQIDIMVKRNLKVNYWSFYLYHANLLLPGWQKHIVKSPSYFPEVDVEHSFQKVPPQLLFNETESQKANTELKRFGVGKGEKFVCVYFRDSGYKLNSTSENFLININDYSFIIDYLLEQGYCVIRSGKDVNTPLNYDHPKVIDYGYKYQSDLMDIWLPAHCEFMINGGGGGLVAASYIYRNPMVLFDWNIFDFWSSSVNSLISFQKVFEGDNCLKVSDLLSKDYYQRIARDLHNESSLIIKKNSKDEITSLIEEMILRLNGKWVSKPEEEQLQDNFWKGLKAFDRFHLFHGKENLCRLGSNFIKENQGWLIN